MRCTFSWGPPAYPAPTFSQSTSSTDGVIATVGGNSIGAVAALAATPTSFSGTYFQAAPTLSSAPSMGITFNRAVQNIVSFVVMVESSTPQPLTVTTLNLNGGTNAFFTLSTRVDVSQYSVGGTVYPAATWYAGYASVITSPFWATTITISPSAIAKLAVTDITFDTPAGCTTGTAGPLVPY